MILLLYDALLYLLQQNVLMQYSNNCNVFCCNNRNALFQYRPTLPYNNADNFWVSLIYGMEYGLEWNGGMERRY